MYQQIANECLHLHELGFTYYRIARKLNVDAKCCKSHQLDSRIII